MYYVDRNRFDCQEDYDDAMEECRRREELRQERLIEQQEEQDREYGRRCYF